MYPAAMRTTIEIEPEHRARLLEPAAGRIRLTRDRRHFERVPQLSLGTI
jgi:hypothetical protein